MNKKNKWREYSSFYKTTIQYYFCLRLQNSRFFFSKSVKKSVKRGVKGLRARSARASHARRACEARLDYQPLFGKMSPHSSLRGGSETGPGRRWKSSLVWGVSPQSRSLFSASFQTFCLTARAYLNTQKYGLFCSLSNCWVWASEHLKKCRSVCRVGARGFWDAASFLGQTAACRAKENYFQVSGLPFILGSVWADPLLPSRCGTAIEIVVLISMTHTPPLNKKVLISWRRWFYLY